MQRWKVTIVDTSLPILRVQSSHNLHTRLHAQLYPFYLRSRVMEFLYQHHQSYHKPELTHPCRPGRASRQLRLYIRGYIGSLDCSGMLGPRSVTSDIFTHLLLVRPPR